MRTVVSHAAVNGTSPPVPASACCSVGLGSCAAARKRRSLSPGSCASCRDLHASYGPAFRACIQDAKVESVMCSYNAVNGKPACASPELLQGTLRGEYGFTGVIVSDCGAVDGIFNLHEYTKCAWLP